MYAFADDLNILSPCVADLQNGLNVVFSWVKEWELLINADKSEHFIIRCKTYTIVHLGNQIIPRVETMKDLGVLINDQLKWSAQCTCQQNKIEI